MTYFMIRYTLIITYLFIYLLCAQRKLNNIIVKYNI